MPERIIPRLQAYQASPKIGKRGPAEAHCLRAVPPYQNDDFAQIRGAPTSGRPGSLARPTAIPYTACMGKLYDSIDESLAAWVRAQHLFFVATAPLAGGHVNTSPKGLDSLRVLGPRSVSYLDFSGSGVETIAHLRENGRITLMFCAFSGPPRILRLQGRGTVVMVGQPDYERALQPFAPLEPALRASARAVISVEIDRIADSCGYGVPLMSYEGDRTQIPDWTENRLRKLGPEGLLAYRRQKNLVSIDGLPGLEGALLDEAGDGQANTGGADSRGRPG